MRDLSQLALGDELDEYEHPPGCDCADCFVRHIYDEDRAVVMIEPRERYL